MNKVDMQVMLIAQEECAEVTQAISKVFRFGFESIYDGRTNKDRLEEEIGDLMCMLQMMDDRQLIDWTRVAAAAVAKKQKLKTWSNISD